jgi:hypothetical protein
MACCQSHWSAALTCCLCHQDIDGLAIAIELRWPTDKGETQTAQRWAHRTCLPRYGQKADEVEDERAHRSLDA